MEPGTCVTARRFLIVNLRLCRSEESKRSFVVNMIKTLQIVRDLRKRSNGKKVYMWTCNLRKGGEQGQEF